MYRVKDYYDALDEAAPFSLSEPWDNTGILIGSPENEVNGALMAPDVTSAVLDEARGLGANLIITHHPIIFSPLKSIGAKSLPYRIIERGISVICAHTNLDIAPDGVNDALAERLGLKNIRPLSPVSPQYREEADMPQNRALQEKFSLGRIGELERALSPDALAKHTKERLGAAGIRFTNGGEDILTVAVCGGSGADLLTRAKEKGAQALVTADVKHNQFIEAGEIGMTILDAGHFATENVVMEPLARRLRELLPQARIAVSTACGDGVRYL